MTNFNIIFSKKKLCFRFTTVAIIFSLLFYYLLMSWSTSNLKSSLFHWEISEVTDRTHTSTWQEVKLPKFNFETGDEYFRSERSINNIDCKTLQVAETVAKIQPSTHNIALAGDRNRSTTCTELTTGYITSSLTRLEETFPIAYSILMYKDVAQVWTLLQAIYRPQNLYCVHIDRKSPPDVWAAMENIVSCLDNVFIASRAVDVKWGTYTVLKPDIVCMHDLWKRSSKWRYFINLTGQEFPLKTNYELVRILVAYGGANDVSGTITRRQVRLFANAGDPPDDIRPVKGSVHVVLSRKFVDYIVTDMVAERLLNWSKRVQHASEWFFNTLNFNPQLRIPGSFWSHNVSLIESKPFLARYKIWYDHHLPCSGKYVRSICIFDVGDLKRLSISKELFANKFHWEAGSKVAEYCMAELIYNRTKENYFGRLTFNDEHYRNQDFVKYHIK